MQIKFSILLYILSINNVSTCFNEYLYDFFLSTIFRPRTADLSHFFVHNFWKR